MLHYKLTMKIETKWKLKKLLKISAESDFDSLIKKGVEANYSFINKWKKRTDYQNSAIVLKEALTEFEKLNTDFGILSPVMYYLWLKSELNQSDPKIKAEINKLNIKAVEIINDISFFTHRLARVPKEIQKKFLQDKTLFEYKHFLKHIFSESKYLLSEEAEKIMIIKSKTSKSNWEQMIESLLSKETAKIEINGKKEDANFSRLIALSSDAKKETRNSASKHVNRILRKISDIAEIELNSILEDKLNDDILRKVKRDDELRHLTDDIESSSVDTLIEEVKNSFQLSKKYYQIKAEILGVKKLKYNERNIPVGAFTKKFTFEESYNIVEKTFNDLSPKFSSILKSFITNGQIDVFPAKGKAGGAFCTHDTKKLPVFVMLNFTGTVEDILTFAHEMGHAIHFELAKKNNSLNFGASTATAEVASIFMEDFALQNLLKLMTEKEKLTLLMHKLNEDISTIQRQVAIYLFEKDLHREFKKQGYLSKKDIGEIFIQNMKNYLGDFVEISKGVENWWIYISHIRNFFYVYSYASGALISKALQHKIKNNHIKIDKYINFLEAGTSDSPQNLFSSFGIDISKKEFWNEGLQEISLLLNQIRKYC